MSLGDIDLGGVVPHPSPRAKRLSLRVHHAKGVIQLVLPPRADKYAIARFLNTHRQWIEEKTKTLHPKTVIENGTSIDLYGELTIIKVTKHDKRSTLIDHDPQKSILSITTGRDDITSNLKRWVIEQARELLTCLAYEKADQINKTVNKIDLRDTSSRWGSCSSDGRLMFSWRLIMAPPFVLDYVVAHEVAHLSHMDHSRDFWDVCYSLCAEGDKARAWLRNNGHSLLSVF